MSTTTTTVQRPQPPPAGGAAESSPAARGAPARRGGSPARPAHPERVGDIGVAVWIARDSARRGGVTTLAGRWRDCGSPVPGYLADALDRLTRSGQLALADPGPRSRGARPVTVTATGHARYAALCQVHTPPGSGRPPADTAPAGRPDTTTPVAPARPVTS